MTTAFTRADVEGVKAFDISGSFIDDYFPQYNSVASNGDVSFIVKHGEVKTADGDGVITKAIVLL